MQSQVLCENIDDSTDVLPTFHNGNNSITGSSGFPAKNGFVGLIDGTDFTFGAFKESRVGLK
jgi:hypothetical protein